MQPTLGLIVEPPAPEVAPGDAADVATLPPSEVALSFGPEIFPGLPAPRSVGLSVLLHGLVIAPLITIRFPLAMPPPQPAQEALSPTEIRIGQHVYYVARIPPPDA